MRTTIEIDDRLGKALKKRAVETGSTVSRLIEDAVRLMLEGSPGEAAEFELVTFGEGGDFTFHDTDVTSALLENADVERYGDIR